jgi:hypothetical protein
MAEAYPFILSNERSIDEYHYYSTENSPLQAPVEDSLKLIGSGDESAAF